MVKVLITGSCGLIGSEAALFFGRQDFEVHGLDNNQRALFFGLQGDTRWNLEQLKKKIRLYVHYNVDIRNREGILSLISKLRPACIVHSAAQPSHDRAAAIPFDDFDTNAAGTMNLLEAARRFCPESPFIHMSTNKVYGDGPNAIRMKELDSRWDYDDAAYKNGIPETLPVDQSMHSLFGASKLSADIIVQEYGRYFNMPTCSLRGGCITGPHHAAVELHGFLSYLVKTNLSGTEYKIYGYKGKQVRDNVHSLDVAHFIFEFYKNPRIGEVYNIGGGKENSCSILEAIRVIESISGRRQVSAYVDQNRIGDHICYYSDLRKAKAHYPNWSITRSLHDIVAELINSWQSRSGER